MRRLTSSFLISSALIFFGQIGIFPEMLGSGIVYADDHGGDDDGDDNDNDDDNGAGAQDDDRGSPSKAAKPSAPGAARSSNSVIRGLKQKRQQRPARKKPIRKVAAPVFDVVALDLPQEGLTRLLRQGYRTISDAQLSQAGVRVTKLRVPRGRGVNAARSQLLSAGAGSADLNALYRPEATECTGKSCELMQAVAWPVEARLTCGSTARIGIVDTAIAQDHPVLSSAKLETITLTPSGKTQSNTAHGTAVAAILTGTETGLLPTATVVAADPYFSLGKGVDRAELIDVIRALDVLSAKSLHVINMSLSGPDNAVLAEVVGRIQKKGTAIVAAAGNNGGSARPMFPAGYDFVIAVSAIDRSNRIWRRSARGKHIDFVAPGVNLTVADGKSGWRTSSGTSFAAPVVAASLAVLLAQGKTNIDQAVEQLSDTARDLGTVGRDPNFGWGLIQAGNVCDPLPLKQ